MITASIQVCGINKEEVANRYLHWLEGARDRQIRNMSWKHPARWKAGLDGESGRLICQDFQNWKQKKEQKLF